MPVLKNARHEQFAREMIKGMKSGRSQGMSYIAAGYQVTGQVAESAASRLLKNVESGVAARVAELAGAGARRAEVTAASLLEKLDRVYDGASAAEQFSAAGRAVEAQAKIAGVMVEKHEVGAPGSFSEPTVAETLQMVAREFGPMTASAVAWTLEHNDREMPVDEIARFTLAAMTLDEALARHEQLRAALLKAASDGAVLVPAVPKDDPPTPSTDRHSRS
jgi:hypothetical protein